MTKNNEDTVALTRRAYEASGHKTYEGFAKEFGCHKRSLSGWMTGDRRPDGMHQMTLGQIALGWHPEPVE